MNSSHVLFLRVDLRQRQDGSRYAFVEFGSSQHVQDILGAGPFALEDHTVRISILSVVFNLGSD